MARSPGARLWIHVPRGRTTVTRAPLYAVSFAVPPSLRTKLPKYSLWPDRSRIALQTGAYIGLAGLLLFVKPGLFPIVFETE